MSKIVKVSNGNYKLSVQSGGTITLETGARVGTVVVTGNLTVLGSTTTVTSETLTIRDNTVVVNYGESGNGVTLNEAGLQVSRGNYDDAQILFTENISYYSPTTATNKAGTFVFKDAAGLLRGIKTNSITTGGGNLALINAGTGLVTVTGTQNYHDNVQASSDSDVLVTRGWVTRYVNSSGYPSGIAVVDRLYNGDTGIQAYDTSVYGGSSNTKFRIDNTVVSTLTSTTLSITTTLDVNGKTLISGNTISAQTAGDNLILTPASGKFIETNGPMQLNNQTDPSSSSGNTKLYAKSTVGTGKTGLYFVNTTTSGELIQKNRALLWSMLF